MTYRHILLLLCCIILTSCANQKHFDPAPNEEDLACSYFYFLWGTHAEFHQQLPEAFEAFEKALICDPTAQYITEKLPLLLLKMGEDEKAARMLRTARVKDPNNVSYLLFLANIYVQQNKTDEAITLYDQILIITPENEAVQLRLGLLHTQLNNFKTAELFFRNLLNQNSNSYFSRLYLARLLLRTGKNNKASKEYEQALSLNWSKDLAYEIGHFYTNMAKFDDALRIFTTITENDHQDEKAALNRIQALLNLSKNDEALEGLELLKPNSRNPAKIDIVISKVLLRKNDIEGAQAILTNLSEKQQNDEARYLLALLAYENDHFDKALGYLRTIKTEDEQFENAVYLQSKVLRKKGKLVDAITVLEKIISADSNRSPLFYTLLSVLYQDNRDNSTAVSLMETAVSLYPDNHQLFFQYGLLLEKNGLSMQAMKSMKKVLELQPNHPEALNFIGYTWADKNINLQQALNYIQKAVRLRPDNGYIVDSLGWVYFRLGKLVKAATMLERSILLEPTDPHIYDHLGDVYLAQKKYSKALEVYNKAYLMFNDEKKKTVIKDKINTLEKLIKNQIIGWAN